MIPSRVELPKGEEYLVDFRTIFVTNAGKIDEQARAQGRPGGAPVHPLSHTRLREVLQGLALLFGTDPAAA